jgi:putative transposase
VYVTRLLLDGVLKEHEAGAKVDEIGRRHGINPATFYTWRKKYGGMEESTLT